MKRCPKCGGNVATACNQCTYCGTIISTHTPDPCKSHSPFTNINHATNHANDTHSNIKNTKYCDKEYIEAAHHLLFRDLPRYSECHSYQKRIVENQDIPPETGYELIINKYDELFEDSSYSTHEKLMVSDLPNISAFSSPDIYLYSNTVINACTLFQDLLLSSGHFFRAALKKNTLLFNSYDKERLDCLTKLEELLPKVQTGYYNALLNIDGKEPLTICGFLYNVLIKDYIKNEKLAEKETKKIFRKPNYDVIINSFSNLISNANECFEEIQYLCELYLDVNQEYLDFIDELCDDIVLFMQLCDSKRSIYQFLQRKATQNTGDLSIYKSLCQESEIYRQKLDVAINALLPHYQSMIHRIH